MITPTFVNVAGGEYDIDNLQVVGVDDTGANIQVMDAAGAWTGMYYWFNEFTDPDTGTVFPAGWMDFDGTASSGVTLKPGDAVFFNTSTEGASVQSAGQVPGSITNEVAVGFTMVGNGSPVAIDVDKFEVLGVDDTGANIQVMNAAGAWTGMYYWFNEFTDPDTGTVFPAGWMDFDGTASAGITLQPGDSVFFNTSTTGAKVVIPSAL